MNQIERGLRLFHKFPLDQGLFFLEKPNYPHDEAYLWRYPSGDVVTYGSGMKLDEHEDVRSLFLPNHLYDCEFILKKEGFSSAVNFEYTHRALHEEHAAHMAELQTACSEQDLAYGQVSIKDDAVVGVYREKLLIGAASIWTLEEDLVDIGVLIHPDYRGLGLGSSIVSFLIESLPTHKIPLYRADYDNLASVHIAIKLGFTEFSRVYRMRKNSQEDGNFVR